MSFKLCPLFSHNMVIQRDKPALIWGKCPPNAQVSMAFELGSFITSAAENGSWQIEIPSFPAGGPYAMIFCCRSEEIKVDGVYFGDVWLCGGQSNMELKMSRVYHMYPEEFEGSGFPMIRVFNLPQEHSLEGTRDEILGGSWLEATADNLNEISAVGYFFAKEIHRRYGVAVGLLASAVGGTPIHSWMGADMLKSFPDALAEMKRWANPKNVKAVSDEEKQRSAEYIQRIDRVDEGLNGSWHLPDYDDKGWERRTLDKPWEKSLAAPGSIWFRRSINIPEELAGKPATFFLGTIVDADTIYVNGIEVGQTAYRYPPREYKLDALPKGRCVIAVRVLNFFGNGGFTPGKMRLLSCEGRTISLNGEWKYKRATYAPVFIEETNFAWKPASYYNAMIFPIHRKAIRGVIWYQGESDTKIPENYGAKMISLINGWREKWNDEFSFLFSQLAYYQDDSGADWESLRKQQEECLILAKTAMVHAMDAGEFNDLHPLNKELIAKRLARAAFAVEYGEKLPPSPFQLGPLI